MSSATDIQLLVICRHAPYGSARAREAIELRLAASVYAASTTVVFIGDGVLQLIDGQEPEPLGGKHHQRLLHSLPMYDIEQVYADAESLARHDLDGSTLIDHTVIVDSAQISALIARAAKVIAL